MAHMNQDHPYIDREDEFNWEIAPYTLGRSLGGISREEEFAIYDKAVSTLLDLYMTDLGYEVINDHFGHSGVFGNMPGDLAAQTMNYYGHALEFNYGRNIVPELGPRVLNFDLDLLDHYVVLDKNGVAHQETFTSYFISEFAQAIHPADGKHEQGYDLMSSWASLGNDIRAEMGEVLIASELARGLSADLVYGGLVAGKDYGLGREFDRVAYVSHRDLRDVETNKNDLLIDGNESSVMRLGGGHDVAWGQQGNDKIFGGRGRDVLLGGEGHDRLVGGQGRDILRGGEGNDYLDGGIGNDRLVGGDGMDLFVFRAGSGKDVIKDFSISDDAIDLVDFASVNSLEDLRPAITETDDGLIFDLGGGDSLEVVGADIYALDVMNIGFGWYTAA